MKYKERPYKDYIYLDYNATTPVLPEVLDAMLPYFKEKFANPSSAYPVATKLNDEVMDVRRKIVSLLGGNEPEEIIFTSGATESINMAIRGYLKLVGNSKVHLITSQVEHSAVYNTFKDLQRDGYEVDFIGVDRDGNLNIEELLDKIKDNTVLVSIMWANNETGVIFDIPKISRLVKEKKNDIIFHTDATQAIGKIPVIVPQTIDMLSMSGHKIYGPKGIGILYLKKGTKIRSFITGGTHEFGKRAGTLNTPYIMGLGKAFELAYSMVNNSNYISHLENLRNYLEKQLQEKIPYININGKNAPRVPNTSNVGFDAIEGESIVELLYKKGFFVSTKSACASKNLEPSRVLKAMGVPLLSMHSNIRISLGYYTTKEDIDLFVNTLVPIIESLRKISPFWDSKAQRPIEDTPQKWGV